ncbi:hypothetical protein E5163_07340 [Marinicauda algicola]|uniref:Uncharacterized protein n=1 Tax=Marinicauda algicola TaxID=2029849 RepID=A0A4V3RY42_9PROT|nr:hypothetical protein [Marinicauda algicola]TGY88939.1 hypothetical protein E5163_07340 [Marinicauda algicola]
MPGYFEDQLAHCRAMHERELASRFHKIFAENAAAGNLLSGYTVLCHRRAVADQVHAFGEDLVKKLTAFDPEHSPIRKSDFALAKVAVSDFQIFAGEQYARSLAKIGRGLPAGVIDEVFVDGANARVEAELEIEGHRLEHRSRLSFWKWAFGNLKRQVWTAGVALLSGAIGAVLKAGWDYL